MPDNRDVVTLWRPTGENELDLVKELGWRAWPPRLPEQPIFYPVLHRWYATKIAREWNVPHRGVGFVTQFDVDRAFLDTYELHQAAAAMSWSTGSLPKTSTPSTPTSLAQSRSWRGTAAPYPTPTLQQPRPRWGTSYRPLAGVPPRVLVAAARLAGLGSVRHPVPTGRNSRSNSGVGRGAHQASAGRDHRRRRDRRAGRARPSLQPRPSRAGQHGQRGMDGRDLAGRKRHRLHRRNRERLVHLRVRAAMSSQSGGSS